MSLRGGHFCIGTNGRHPEAGSNKWCVFVQIPFWSAQQETCVTWCLQPPPPSPQPTTTTTSSQSSPPLLPPSSEREVRRGEKDHPHWDHSPSIRAFHTLWTWNNRGLIAAVCLWRLWLEAWRLSSSEARRLGPVKTGWDAPGGLLSTGRHIFLAFYF